MTIGARISIIILFIILAFTAFTNTVDDSIKKNNDVELYGKYLKLSTDEQFTLVERKAFVNKAIEYLEGTNQDSILIKAYLSYGYILAQEGAYSKAFELYERIMNISDGIGYRTDVDWRRKAFFANVEGILYKELGVYNKALEAYFESLFLSDSLAWMEGQSTALNNISNLYYLQGNISQAIETMRTSLAIAESFNEPIYLFDVYYNLMTLYTESGQLDSANIYRQLAEYSANQLNSNYTSCTYQIASASLLIKEKKLHLAELRFKEALNIALENSFYENQIHIYRGLSKIEISKGNILKAEKYTVLGLALLDSTDLPKLEIDLLYDLSNIYEKQDKLSKAYSYLKHAQQFEDSINRSWELIRYSEIQNIYDLELQQNENLILEKNLSITQLKLKQNNTLLIASLFLAILLFILLFIMYKKRQFEKKTTLAIQEQNKTIREQQALIHLQKENQLKIELDYKSRQLTSHALSVLKHAKAAEAISHTLSQIIYNHDIKSETKNELSRVINSLRNDLLKSDWNEFKTYYNQVHTTFYANLNEKFPNLSATDEKMCAFISLGLSTKEIATLTYRQVRSVESARLRLRKKLGLDVSEDLFDFLKQF